MGMIYMIIGKSATGKDHLYHILLNDPALSLKPLVIYTTRPKRASEEDGREYHFTDEKHLNELRDAGKIIEERVYPTVNGNWYYFTADDGQIDGSSDYITIGTLESFIKMKEYFGESRMTSLYLETDAYLRLSRSIRREHKQENPEYKEICRRFLADEEDFSERRLAEAGISLRLENNDTLQDCAVSVRHYILKKRGEPDG